MPTFAALRPEYDRLWSSMVVRSQYAATVAGIAAKLSRNKARYQAVSRTTGVPWFVLAALHERESSANFKTYLGNGEPLNRRTVLVPRGRGPFATWEDGAIDAIRYDGLDKVTDWSPARICYEIEKFNGFGYRNNHPSVLSPYLWSYSNHYSRGKYTGDGVFDSTAVDQQCGAIPVVKVLMQTDQPVVKPVPPPAPPPAPPAPQPSTNWFIALLRRLFGKSET